LIDRANQALHQSKQRGGDRMTMATGDNLIASGRHRVPAYAFYVVGEIKQRIGSSASYLGVDVDDALGLAEQTDV
jgi:hypothetical protein